VVLMDLIMPGMDGIEATRIIHERWPHIQVLVLTSFTEKEMIQGALDAGARGYLIKNVRGRELVDAILEVHRGRQAIAQEARQSLQLSEQLSILEKEIREQNPSTASLSGLLNKRLTTLFPNFQTQVYIYPDHELFTYPAQSNTLIPEQAWEWLQTAGEIKIFYAGQDFPWGGKLTCGEILLLKPIKGEDQGKFLGGISFLSKDVPPDTGDMIESINALAGILAAAFDRQANDIDHG
jgi:CheY-like chemotaxis protein